MTLLQQQQEFSRNVALLLIYADRLGYKYTFGEAWRSPEAAQVNAKLGKGISNSLHIDRLAIDINLFDKDGAYIRDNRGHEDLAIYWKGLSVLNAWGGDFKSKDFNHYSSTYQGRK